MVKGFYNLTSGVISQQKRLNIIANNMTNLSTAGYKSDSYSDSTFGEYVVSRIGNKDKSGGTEIGNASYILAPDGIYTDYSQGGLEPTGGNLDFAIAGDGFFAVQTDDGIAYTRDGAFSLDNQGYLTLPGKGRVLGIGGQPLHLGTDHIEANVYGSIYGKNGNMIGKLGVFKVDADELKRNNQGLFQGAQGQVVQTPVHWKYVERSNVDLVEKMTEMMSTQRALQSASQVIKIYDQLLKKATEELGHV